MKRPLVIALLISILGLSAFLMGRLLTTETISHLEPNEALAQQAELGATSFDLGGLIKPGSIDTDGDVLRFVVTDLTGAEITVRTTETPPDLFSDKIGVWLKGTFDGDEYHATSLILRHDETYKAPPEQP